MRIFEIRTWIWSCRGVSALDLFSKHLRRKTRELATFHSLDANEYVEWLRGKFNNYQFEFFWAYAGTYYKVFIPNYSFQYFSSQLYMLQGSYKIHTREYGNESL